jgi:hypothetical protein
MYGMVNQAVKGFVEENHGLEMWRKIHTKAGAPESFAAMSPYEDAITYNLVGAASELLQTPAEKILKGFGEYWVDKVATAHYESIMTRSGQNFVDFVKNLDHMHQRIRVTFPNYNPPSFRVKVLAPGQLQVDYYSDRAGLLPFVEGLFIALGRYFRERADLTYVDTEKLGLPCKRMLIAHAPLT